MTAICRCGKTAELQIFGEVKTLHLCEKCVYGENFIAKNFILLNASRSINLDTSPCCILDEDWVINLKPDTLH